MLSSTDHDKLQQIIQEHPETEELFNRIFKSHQMDISTISHEIRNPLTLVYSTLQLIESPHPEVLEFAHWSELHQDIEYMKLLLEDLSSYNNGERLDLAPLSTGSFFRRITLSFASSIIDTDIEFTSYIPEDLPVLSADSVKLRQALLNLLRNAADAVRTESPSQDQHDMPAHSPQISLSVTADADLLHIEISDNGCGIAPEDQEHIFEPFITHKVDGTGLGLAITRRIIQAHHGTITLRSARYAGTVFILTLPIEKNS